MTAAIDLDDPTTDPFAVAELAAETIAARTGVPRHDVALVLGSGWGGAADLLGETDGLSWSPQGVHRLEPANRLGPPT